MKPFLKIMIATTILTTMGIYSTQACKEGVGDCIRKDFEVTVEGLSGPATLHSFHMDGDKAPCQGNVCKMEQPYHTTLPADVRFCVPNDQKSTCTPTSRNACKGDATEYKATCTPKNPEELINKLETNGMLKATVDLNVQPCSCTLSAL